MYDGMKACMCVYACRYTYTHVKLILKSTGPQGPDNYFDSGGGARK